jgi:hypothetical protein
LRTPSARFPALLVALVGLTSLMYELLQVRVLAFFLGNSVDFLAIPIALLGLALGSMAAHFLFRDHAERLVRWAGLAVLPLIAAAFLLLFFVADTWFSSIHAGLADPRVDLLRLVVYSAIFLPPYLALGAMLAALFGAWAERIGRLYFFDLAGAALGCVLTPLRLTWVDLWAAILGVLGGALGLWIIAARRRVPLAVAGVLGFLAVAVLAERGLCFREHPDPNALARFLPGGPSAEVTPLATRWNHIARTALLEVRRPWEQTVERKHYVVQDNGLSNVWLTRWEPDEPREDVVRSTYHHRLPWSLGQEPESILVLFAGAGRDLIRFHHLSEGRAELVGVELNPAVRNMSLRRPMAYAKLHRFLQLPHVHLEIEEGRDFLNRDDRLYDHIHVANNGSVSSARSGHTRKFLDTREAMAAYLDHLAPGGFIVFRNQPVTSKLRSFVELFEERELGDPLQCMIVFGLASKPHLDSLVVKPTGFSAAEVQTVHQLVVEKGGGSSILYAPGRAVPANRVTEALEDPATIRRVTDDRPFIRGLQLGSFTLTPSEEQLEDRSWVSSWVKVLTVLIFALVAGLAALVARVLGGRDARVPGPWIAYLLASGVGYMAVEIGLIAKTELFVGNPLYAVALNLAAFLVANSIGALLQDRYDLMRGPAWLAGLTVLSVIWGLLAVQACNSWLLSLPLGIKALGVVVATAPAGVALGCFYPYCVQRLSAAGQRRCVPMTYALTTLSSVLGSVFAMTAIIELGFSAVIVLGLGLYLLASGIAWGVNRSV